MLALFRAVVKFCSTNRLFTYVDGQQDTDHTKKSVIAEFSFKDLSSIFHLHGFSNKNPAYKQCSTRQPKICEICEICENMRNYKERDKKLMANSQLKSLPSSMLS